MFFTDVFHPHNILQVLQIVAKCMGCKVPDFLVEWRGMPPPVQPLGLNLKLPHKYYRPFQIELLNWSIACGNLSMCMFHGL